MKHSILLTASAYTGVTAGILLLCLPALLKLPLHTYKFYIYAGVIVLSLSGILPLLLKTRIARSSRPETECA